MKAIILAAGIGSRLKPITDEIPKCMVSVNNKMIIDKQIEGLLKNGVSEIYVASGYKNEILEQHIKRLYKKVNIIHNKVFDKTNNMYSLFLSEANLRGSEFILLNADVFVHDKIFEEICNTNIENAIVCEKGIYNEESMKIILNGNIKEISKKISKEDAYAVSIDIYKFSKDASTKLFDKVSEYIDIMHEKNLWTEIALNDILKECKFEPLEINSPWMEIDNHEDLKAAEKLFGK